MSEDLTSGKNPPNSVGTARILGGILVNLFICPGLGHKLVGRNYAARVIIVLFFLSFFALCGFLYYFVYNSIAQMNQKALDIGALVQLIKSDITKGTGLYLSFLSLVGIYIFAPFELLIVEIYKALKARKS